MFIPFVADNHFSILEIVVHGRSLVLTHGLLLPVHLRYLATARGIVGLLVLSRLDVSWEPQTDTLVRSIADFARGGTVTWTQCQICRLDFPDELRLEPNVRLVVFAG